MLLKLNGINYSVSSLYFTLGTIACMYCVVLLMYYQSDLNKVYKCACITDDDNFLKYS